MPVTKSPTKTTAQSLLHQSVQFLKGVGPKRSEILGRLGIHTIHDMLSYFPRDYKDRTRIQKISEAKIGAEITIQAKILAINNRMARNRKYILEAFVSDETGTIAATWFNQPFLMNKFHVGDNLFLHGKVGAYKYLQLLSPEYEVIQVDASNGKEGGIIPVYPLTEHISQTQFRKIMKEAVHHYTGAVEELLPQGILVKNQLLPLDNAIQSIHFPETFDTLKRAKSRLVYDELPITEMAMAPWKSGVKEETGVAFKAGPNVAAHIRKLIPFTLTNAQER